MKGQAGMEYLLIISFFLLLVGVLVNYYGKVSITNSSEIIAGSSLDNFKRTVDRVFALGQPASEVVSVSLPNNIIANRTGLNNSYAQISYYNQYGGIVDTVRLFEFNVSGDFPNSTGTFSLIVYARNSQGVGVNMS